MTILHPPAVVITALNLDNQPLRADLLPDEQIKLSYRENHLSFDFAAPDYTAPAETSMPTRWKGLRRIGSRPAHAAMPTTQTCGWGATPSA